VRESSLTLPLADELATLSLGAALAASVLRLAANDALVLHLSGELGAGKTTCVRGLLRALGERGAVRSPSYTLVESYELEIAVIHCDLYRLRSAAELADLGLRDSLRAGHLLLIEWPERGGSAVPPADLTLSLRYAEPGRSATLTAHSVHGEQWLASVA
jgi:tRNA threonylcarbamoyladenosine biosynthesis protein TsaE